MSTASPTRSPDKRKGRRWARGALFALPLLGLLVGLYVHLSAAADRELRDALAEADRLDPGWRLEDLEATRAPVPDDRNGALIVLAASRGLPQAGLGAPHRLEGLGLPAPVRLREEQAAFLRAKLRGLGSTLEEARKLANLPHGRYPLPGVPNGPSGLAPHHTQVFRLSNLLARDVWLRADDGDADGALASCRALLNTGRSLGDEPTLGAQLTRASCGEFTASSLKRALAQGEPSDAALAAAQELLLDEAAQSLLVTGFRGERASAHRVFTDLESGKTALPPGAGAAGPGFLPVSVRRALWPGVKASHAWLVKYYTDAVEAEKLPAKQQDAALQQLAASQIEALPLARWLQPYVTEYAREDRRSQALLRSAAVALAAERYRRAHGRWPEVLDELVPAYLDRVPTDPFDGAPLRYRRLEDGAVIYSIDLDGKDDGGPVESSKPTSGVQDVGFRLWDVAQRRQPPLPPKETPP